MATSYKFGGSKVPGSEVNRLVVKGSSTNPDEYVDVGGTVELSDEQVEQYRKSGLKFTKSDASDSDDSNGDDEPKTAAEQQEVQRATAQPGAEPTTGRSSGRK